jgi:putative ABC transport system permease protein
VAVDLANASASRAFDLSAETVAGRATHQVSGGPLGLDEDLYASLRRAGLGAPSAPILAEYVASPQLGGQPLQLLGVDPFAEAPFRSYLGSPLGQTALSAGPQVAPAADLSDFLLKPGALLPSSLAERYGLSVGQPSPKSAGVHVGLDGLLQPGDESAAAPEVCCWPISRLPRNSPGDWVSWITSI